MNNPYEVLGVSPSATDDEIKQAYRKLAKKYHPDNYADSPLADVAEQKMKEINEAYDAIVEMRKNGSANSNSQYRYHGNSYTTKYPQIRMLIQQNNLSEAQRLLDAVDVSARDAEWYFLQGMVMNRKGWNEQAYTNFSTACSMDPSNTEYRAALNRMAHQRSYGAGPYNQGGYNSSSCSCCDICAAFMCADCLCDCMRCC
ncbi:MAG: DnaJ domain-containing protein [Acutalibacteraceae bacterium]